MRNSLWLPLTLGLSAAVVGPAGADVWDVQTQNDNSIATENELVHGSDQLHDLGALAGQVADQDWYRLTQRSYSSYEVVVDGTSGDIGTTLRLERIASDGTTVVQASAATGLGYSRSLRWANTTAAPVNNEYIRVISGSCTGNCGPDDVYRVRFSETTYAIPRFNNSGTQVTVLLLQNPSDYTIAGTVYFWTAAGALHTSTTFNLTARQLYVLPTHTVATGISGSMTIANNGRYGDLAGKAVALEPSTGFSFDNPMVPRFR